MIPDDWGLWWFSSPITWRAWAIALTYLAFTEAGAHVLLPEGAYRPSCELADRVLTRFGVETEMYDPLVGGGIAALIL